MKRTFLPSEEALSLVMDVCHYKDVGIPEYQTEFDVVYHKVCERYIQHAKTGIKLSLLTIEVTDVLALKEKLKPELKKFGITWREMETA